MKKITFLKFILLFFSVVFSQDGFAQDYTQLGLPEGAIARLGKGGAVTAVAYSPDGKTIASGSSGEIHLWNAVTGEHKLAIWGGGQSVVYSPDGSTLSSGDSVWNAETGQHKLTLTDSWGYTDSVVYSPDGNTLAGGGSNGIRLWDAETGKHKLTLDRPVPGIRTVAYSPNGDQLAVGNNLGIWLYNLRSDTEAGLLTGHTREVLSVTYSPDGSTLASGGAWGDNTIRLWDAKTGKYQQTLPGTDSRIHSIAYSSNCDMMASGEGWSSNTIRLWDVKTGEHIQTFSGHNGDVHSIAFSPDGKTLVSGSSDETILLWDLTPFVNANGSVSILPSPVESPTLGSQLTLSLNISDAENVAGYQATVTFDATSLRYISSKNGEYLSANVIAVPPVVTEDTVTLAAASLAGEHQGGGTLATLTFEVVDARASTLRLSKVLLTDVTGENSCPQIQNGQITEPQILKEDVTGDSTVNIQDLVLIASNFGKLGESSSDVNGDGIVNIVDMILVAAALGQNAGAPSTWHSVSEIAPTSAEVQQWLQEARQVNLTDPIFQRGILMLEQLLTSLLPKETVLLSNYPNPFNPETWIPYLLAEPADVTVSIYSADGKLIRMLALGNQAAGIYESRNRAAYWDGKNEVGESVASGVYFYTLTAGDFTMTRKMLIRK